MPVPSSLSQKFLHLLDCNLGVTIGFVVIRAREFMDNVLLLAPSVKFSAELRAAVGSELDWFAIVNEPVIKDAGDCLCVQFS